MCTDIQSGCASVNSGGTGGTLTSFWRLCYWFWTEFHFGVCFLHVKTKHGSDHEVLLLGLSRQKSVLFSCKAKAEDCFWQGLWDNEVAPGMQLVPALCFSRAKPWTTPRVFPQALKQWCMSMSETNKKTDPDPIHSKDFQLPKKKKICGEQFLWPHFCWMRPNKLKQDGSSQQCRI